ncbi:MAG: hypothetical protein JO189_32315 [Deltaproteobacteria bacterium]|nr:hypothetical protein [Deltaproteobacteria bacterium]
MGAVIRLAQSSSLGKAQKQPPVREPNDASRAHVLELRRGKGSRCRPLQIHHLSHQHHNRIGRRFPDRPLPPPHRRAIIVRLLVLAALLAVAYALAPC